MPTAKAAQMAISIRADAGHEPGIACSQYADATRYCVARCNNKAKSTMTSSSTQAGVDSTVIRAALVLSDVLLVPFQPRSYDVWALNDIAALVGRGAECA